MNLIFMIFFVLYIFKCIFVFIFWKQYLSYPFLFTIMYLIMFICLFHTFFSFCFLDIALLFLISNYYIVHWLLDVSFLFILCFPLFWLISMFKWCFLSFNIQVVSFIDFFICLCSFYTYIYLNLCRSLLTSFEIVPELHSISCVAQVNVLNPSTPRASWNQEASVSVGGMSSQSFQNIAFDSVFVMFPVKHTVIYTFFAITSVQNTCFCSVFNALASKNPAKSCYVQCFFHFWTFFHCRKGTKMTQNSISIPSCAQTPKNPRKMSKTPPYSGLGAKPFLGPPS